MRFAPEQASDGVEATRIAAVLLAALAVCAASVVVSTCTVDTDAAREERAEPTTLVRR